MTTYQTSAKVMLIVRLLACGKLSEEMPLAALFGTARKLQLPVRRGERLPGRQPWSATHPEPSNGTTFQRSERCLLPGQAAAALVPP
jgi:hypothetical protein